jgi:polyhydroxyalkanoate synthesis regulator protein
MDTVIPKYLEHSMAAFAEQQDTWRQMMTGGGAIPSFEDMARNNMAMFEQATKMWTGGLGQNEGAAKGDKTDELSQMRAQMAAMQDQLNKMSRDS